MARIRTIKPEFFTSEDIVELSALARLLYIALWCEADRLGRLVWKPKTLKWKYLPGDDCSVDQLASELVRSGLVVTYEVEGESYAYIPTFLEHQHINQREAESRIPGPNGKHVHARALPARADVKVTEEIRETVLARDKHQCVRCGSKEKLEIDHIFPVSLGGTNALTNLRVLCESCNRARPVAGQALLDDLAKDGLALEDVGRICAHVRAHGEGKGREGKEPASRELFEKFWAEYPKKKSKGDAEKAWSAIKPDEHLADQILQAVQRAKTSDQWLKDQGKFIPYPASWLRDKAWLDDDGTGGDVPVWER